MTDVGYKKKGTKKVFLSYLGDDNKIISGFVDLIGCDNNFVIFQTNKNVIRIPTSRVLKIKEGLTDE